MIQLDKLSTERHNPKTKELDMMSVTEILHIMNEEDQKVANAITRILPKIENAIEIVYEKLSAQGRLFYMGAGTSGRLGLLDAAECPPTFSTDPNMVQAVLAGGLDAVMVAVEGAEDNFELGIADLKDKKFSSNDVVIGIAASGRTPYVAGGLSYAQSIGAKTISLTSNTESLISTYADVAIEVDTGPEILTGSTRLKAATAHKMVLNMISTVAMIRLGKVYKNLMVDVRASNHKLQERAKKIVCEATGFTYEEAELALEETEYNVKQAIIMILTKTSAQEAAILLKKANGKVRLAIIEGGAEE
ncbi:N-acetylmuramic acid 6-phosphate etherase [Psychrobacillus sp. Sa2BUA9]|uniref:N-acetylmuramic acid 6-phosphate etherase n=1 Tax=Psychrobacillus faecigallinarum TaxID=2762235 RepID=A0ABR8R9Z0_9BACI|nr:N-acetylmuramic acid 6-phosphate etherase [Psychrobacillus faecigallinarum]MBD7944626.1 N-acetylmuramic acid 6-phosphate etherase [Psychrobacillus faecigallinarum]